MNTRNIALRAKRAFATPYFYLTMLMMFFIAPDAFALQNTDLTQDSSNGKTVTSVATNIDNTRMIVTSVIIGVFALIGMILVGMSLLQLHKASKEDREKPAGAVVGVIIGGSLLCISAIMWIVRNTLMQ